MEFLWDQLWDYSDHVRAARDYGVARGWLDAEGDPIGPTEAGLYNAFAHAHLSAMISFEFSPSDAWLVGDGREIMTTAEYYYGGRDAGDDFRMDTFRDLHNNRIGRDIGVYAARNQMGPGDIVNLIEDALTRQQRGVGAMRAMAADCGARRASISPRPPASRASHSIPIRPMSG